MRSALRKYINRTVNLKLRDTKPSKENARQREREREREGERGREKERERPSGKRRVKGFALETLSSRNFTPQTKGEQREFLRILVYLVIHQTKGEQMESLRILVHLVIYASG